MRDSPNVELVRSIHAAFERAEYDSVEWAHPEIEFVLADGPAPGAWRGLPVMTEAWREWLRSPWEGYRVDVDGHRELDDERVLVFVRRSGEARRADSSSASWTPAEQPSTTSVTER